MSGLRIPGELGITAHSSRGVFKRSLRERSGIEIEFLLGVVLHIHMRAGLGRTPRWGLSPDDGCAGGSIYIPLARRGNGMIGRLGVSERNPPKGVFPKTAPNLGAGDNMKVGSAWEEPPEGGFSHGNSQP